MCCSGNYSNSWNKTRLHDSFHLTSRSHVAVHLFIWTIRLVCHLCSCHILTYMYLVIYSITDQMHGYNLRNLFLYVTKKDKKMLMAWSMHLSSNCLEVRINHMQEWLDINVKNLYRMLSAMFRNPLYLLCHSVVNNGCSFSVVFRVYDSDGNEYLDSQVLVDIYLFIRLSYSLLAGCSLLIPSNRMSTLIYYIGTYSAVVFFF